MTKTERRISDFSSGMKKLDDKNLSYIRKLTLVMFTVEQSLLNHGAKKKNVELGKKSFLLKNINNDY